MSAAEPLVAAGPMPSPGATPNRPSARQREAAARTSRTLVRRRIVNGVMVGLLTLSAIVATLPLLFILYHLAQSGASSLSVDFFTRDPKSVGETGGGMANAIIGTLIVVGVACAIGLPIGVGAGLYVAEQKHTRLATVVRFLADVLNGLPSIVMGIFAWQFLVRPVGHFSAISGGIALAAMLVPMVTRTTEEMVALVPHSLREAALALGYSRARTGLTIVLRTATAGIVTGALVAVARIAGETAPLLFTALGNQFRSFALDKPIAALPLQIFNYAVSPYDDWHRQAWAGALVLIAIVLTISIVARVATRGHGDGSND